MPWLYLIRHAEPQRRGVFLGRTDAGLTEAGRDMARRLGAIPAATVFTSPLRRARDTAAFVSCERAPTVLPDLAEFDFGEWEGKTWDEAERGWPEVARRKSLDWFGTAPPGGERWEEFAARVHRAASAIERAVAPVAVVAHLVVNSVLAARWLGRNAATFRQDYCEVIEVESPPIRES